MKQNSLEERKKEYHKLTELFPNKLFAIFEKIPSQPGKEIIHKQLLDEDIYLEELYIQFNQKSLKKGSKDPLTQIKIYTASNDMYLEPNDALLMPIYNQYKDEDGFLYLKYSFNDGTKNKIGEKLLQKNPNELPVIINKNPNCSNNINLSNNKFLFKKIMTISMIKASLKKNFLKEGINTLYITATSKYIPLLDNELITDVFNKYNDEKDGLLYLYYSDHFSIENFKLNPLEERKKELASLLQKFPNKIPAILEKDPNYQNNIEIQKNKFLIENTNKVYNFISFFNSNFLHQKTFMDNKLLKINLTVLPNSIKLSALDEFSTIYEKYKDEDGFLYAYYSYEYITMKDLPILTSIYKSIPLEVKMGILSAKPDPTNSPVIILKYPLSFISDMLKKYYTSNNLTLKKLLILFKKDFNKKFPNESSNFILMTDTNIDLREKGNMTIKELFDKYKDKDEGILYLYYIEPLD